jgi:bacteriocin biosynthesis cyclodehydratase domain-containing protein
MEHGVLRLRPLVEVLAATDGDLYLLPGPGGDDLAIRAPSREVRAVVDALRDGAPAVTIAERAGASIDTVEEVAHALRSVDLLEPTAAPEALAAADALRWDRQLLYLRQAATHPATGGELQARLRASRVAIIGCGGLGSWAAFTIATLGVGGLILVDPDRVDVGNLNRQILFDVDDIGHEKATVARRRLIAFDPRLAVTAVTDAVTGPGDVAQLAAGADLVVACADTPVYEISRWINDGCAAAGVPHISAGQMPPIVRVGPFVQPGATACDRCLETSWRRGNPLAAELERMRSQRLAPAATLGPACGLIGSIIGSEALHWITGLRRPATWGSALTIDIRTFRVEHHPVPRDPDCTCAQPK